jgi:hypothetical protein
LQGETVDWEKEFAEPLKRGVDTSLLRRRLVRRDLPGRDFPRGQRREIRRMISSILAGYAWDERNPFVSEAKRRLKVISQSVRDAA